MEKYQLNCKNIHKLPGGSDTAVMNLLFYHGLSEAGQPVRFHEEKPVITQFMDKPGVKVSGRVVARFIRRSYCHSRLNFAGISTWIWYCLKASVMSCTRTVRLY